jgi:putative ABC transport system substrate-binding protein
MLSCVGALASAEGERLPRVAWVVIDTPEASSPGLEAMRAGLADEGFIDGRDVVLDVRFAAGRPERYAELFAELSRSHPNALVAAGIQGITAARDASSGSIPVVAYFCGNDVRQTVATFARPGGNITGVSCLSAELAVKRLELLHEALPRLRRVGLLHDPSVPGKDQELADIRAAATALGVTVVASAASTREGLPQAFDSLQRESVEALLISEDLFSFGNRARIVELAAEHRLPGISAYRAYVIDGGVFSYGPSLTERVRQLGRYAGRVLRGTKPADLPINRPTRFEFVINARAARAMQVTIPPSLLLRADEVIE